MMIVAAVMVVSSITVMRMAIAIILELVDSDSDKVNVKIHTLTRCVRHESCTSTNRPLIWEFFINYLLIKIVII